MALPLALPLIALGATALAGWRIYETQKDADDGVLSNTLARSTLETTEMEINMARENAGEALIQLGEIRTRVWAEPMLRFSTLYQRLIDVTPENTPPAGMVGVPLFTKEQLARINKACQQASARLTTRIAIGDNICDDGPGLTLPKYVHPKLPHDLACTSVIDLAKRLFLKSEVKRLEELACENEEWADKFDADFSNSEEVRRIQEVEIAAKAHCDLLEQLPVRLDQLLDSLEAMTEFNTPEFQRPMVSALRYARVLLMLLETPIITQDGALHTDQRRAADAARELLTEAGNGTA